MKFKVLGSKRKGSEYEFTIQGDGEWSFSDIVPCMINAVSSASTFYIEDSVIKDRRYDDNPSENKGKRALAKFNLESTLVPNVKKLSVSDQGIGKQMIEKFVLGIDKA